MKKKGPRGIPDFSSKRKGPAVPDAPNKPAIHATTPREPIVKPQSTSSKSGRRGA